MTERILVVEDDPRLADMLSEYLGQAGFRVTVAPLGRAALEQLSIAEYDAIVLDLMLPDMDGLDVCRRLRTTSDTPVLMLTGRGDAIDRIVGLEIGADDYLPKRFRSHIGTANRTPSWGRRDLFGTRRWTQWFCRHLADVMGPGLSVPAMVLRNHGLAFILLMYRR